MSESDSTQRSLLQATEHLVSSAVLLGTNVVLMPCLAGPREKVVGELRQAHAVGQFAVLTAMARLKAALNNQETLEAESEEPVVAAIQPDPPSCIPEYINMSAAQIVPLLRGLTDEERAEVATFESSTRHRRTILSALGVPAA